MEKIVAYAKSHPWVLGIGVVVVGLILFAVVGGAGGSSSSGTSGPSDAQIQAEAAVQAAQITAQAQAAAASSSYNLQLQTAQIGAATQSEQARLEAAVAEKALEVQKVQIAADKDVNIANINAQASIANTQTNAQLSAVKNTNKSNIIGGAVKAIGSIAAIFSDERLKTDIKLVGMHPMGFGIYEYKYVFGSSLQTGYLAQEVLKFYPEAVSVHASGFYQINYDLLEFERMAA